MHHTAGCHSGVVGPESVNVTNSLINKEITNLLNDLCICNVHIRHATLACNPLFSIKMQPSSGIQCIIYLHRPPSPSVLERGGLHYTGVEEHYIHVNQLRSMHFPPSWQTDTRGLLKVTKRDFHLYPEYDFQSEGIQSWVHSPVLMYPTVWMKFRLIGLFPVVGRPPPNKTGVITHGLFPVGFGSLIFPKRGTGKNEQRAAERYVVVALGWFAQHSAHSVCLLLSIATTAKLTWWRAQIGIHREEFGETYKIHYTRRRKREQMCFCCCCPPLFLTCQSFPLVGSRVDNIILSNSFLDMVAVYLLYQKNEKLKNGLT